MRIPLTVAAILTAATLDAQENLGPRDLGLSPEAIRAIYVRLADNASGACWTNLREVREFAEEKLRNSGYNVVDNIDHARVPDFVFWIGVAAMRDPFETCDGSISVSVQSMAGVDRFFGVLMLAPPVNEVVSSAGENLNRRVIEAVEEMISHM